MTKPTPAECLRQMRELNIGLEDIEDLSTAAVLTILANAQSRGIVRPIVYACTTFMAGVGGMDFDDDAWDAFLAECKAWAKWRREVDEAQKN